MQQDSRAPARAAELHEFLTATLQPATFDVTPASSDASFRRYFRVALHGTAPLARGASTLIAMDAPPPHEDCRPFVRIARLLAHAGVHAPTVLAEDLARGFLLLTDFGTTMYLDALDAATAQRLYLDAIDALVRWQLASREGMLHPYDAALLHRELELFPDWYVKRHLGAELDAQQQARLADSFRLIVDNNLAQPRVYVHRDYHSRNLMLSSPNPGILDFQDAVYGPITYDLVSLLRDAYISWEEEQVLDWCIRYWEAARKAGLPVAADFADFYRDFEWMGAQRQLKVLGIFARLCYRDGKERYLADQPLVMKYLRKTCERYGELAPLLRVLDVIEPVEKRAGYTF